MPRIGITEGARAPLFDRLAQTPRSARSSAKEQGTLDRAGIARSIQLELERLLNTRCPFPAAALVAAERSVIDYGLPDYSAMYTQNPDDRKKLAALIRSTIEAFEPRLNNVRVEVQILGNSEKALLVKLAGMVRVGRVMERVTFAVDVTAEGHQGAGLGN